MIFKRKKTCSLCGNEWEGFGSVSNIYLVDPNESNHIIKDGDGMFLCSNQLYCHRKAQATRSIPIANAEIYSRFQKTRKTTRVIEFSTERTFGTQNNSSLRNGRIEFMGYTGFQWRYSYGNTELDYNRVYELSGAIIFEDDLLRGKAGEMWPRFDWRDEGKIVGFHLRLNAKPSASFIIERTLAEVFSTNRSAVYLKFEIGESDIESDRNAMNIEE